jgi:hypothetical protein
MNRVRTQKPRIRRDRARLEILPADPRDPDVVRAKALARMTAAGPSRPTGRCDDDRRAARGAMTG